MSKKKIITTASAVALAAMLAFGGTLAYYQGQAESPVENTFVDQGNSVTISETDEDGETTYSNTYSIIPGTTDTKDPVVTAEFTLDSYVYVKAVDTTGDLITWDSASAWTELDGYDNVYYLLLKTVSYDETSGEWTETSTDPSEYTYTEDGLTYTYKGTSDDVGSYTVSKDGVQIYTYTTQAAGSTTLYTASIPVIDGDTITYSSEITNETFDDYGSTVSLDFTAYIIQAWLEGSESYGESYESYAAPAEAYAVALGAPYVSGATYTFLTADEDTILSDALLTALKAATADSPAVIVLPDEDNDVTVTGIELNSAITGTAVVDLNGGTLTVSGGSSVTLDSGEDLTFTDGTVNRNDMSTAASSSFVVTSGASLTLENTTLNSNGTAIYPRGDAAEVNVINSTVKGYAYAIATNAATAENYDVVINVENSELTASGCGVIINVPCTLNISNSTVTGETQALIVRAGTATVTDTELISTLSVNDYNEGIWTTYDNENWGSGNAVAFAVITIGNRNGSYAGDAVVTLDGVTVEYNSGEEGSKGVYLYGGVTYPTTNTEPNKAILNYNSSTCDLGKIVQGEETYTEVNDTAN